MKLLLLVALLLLLLLLLLLTTTTTTVTISAAVSSQAPAQAPLETTPEPSYNNFEAQISLDALAGTLVEVGVRAGY